MQYFKEYVSNTTAASANQLFFCPTRADVPLTGRVYYRVTAGGRFPYSFLYSNIIDSTYARGDVSRANRILPPWKILSLSVGVSADTDPRTLASEELTPVTFGGRRERTVHAGEFFHTDPVMIEADARDYLCLEYVFCGECIPYHEERIIAAYVKHGYRWEDSPHVPFLACLGVAREVDARIVFWGDSITQGIGTEFNSYTHWNARVAQSLGDRYACWNLGIGYGRAADAASLGAWFYKAKHADLAVVCFGVNDILQTGNAAALKESLATAVRALKNEGVAVVLQTVPPFDYNEEHRAVWEEVNDYLKEELAGEVDALFDVVPVLGERGSEHRARYGGHPNARGCARWADALTPVLREVLERLHNKETEVHA